MNQKVWRRQGKKVAWKEQDTVLAEWIRPYHNTSQDKENTNVRHCNPTDTDVHGIFFNIAFITKIDSKIYYKLLKISLFSLNKNTVCK